MGWNLSDSRTNKYRAQFESLEEAIEQANMMGYDYFVEKPNLRKYDSKSYSDNFLWKGPPKEELENDIKIL